MRQIGEARQKMPAEKSNVKVRNEILADWDDSEDYNIFCKEE